MRAMNTSTSTSIPAGAQPQPEGLPRFSYLPPVIATLLAAAFIFLCMLALAFFGVLNTITGFGKVINGEENASLFSSGLCGVLSLVAIVGTIYFFWATIKGVRDLVTPPYYTRGTVMARRAQEREAVGRRANSWVLLQPEYMGPDVARASAINDEQRAASVDRSTILNPRFPPPPNPRATRAEVEAARRDLVASRSARPGYLNPARISSSSQPSTTDLEPDDAARGPHVVFRVDFASKAKFMPDEEVLVAHSRFLEHVYYVARLKNGEWEAYRNRSLI